MYCLYRTHNIARMQHFRREFHLPVVYIG